MTERAEASGRAMRVAAIVVNWNGAEHLAACLDGLIAQTYVDLDIIVVDNDSHDGSAAILAGYDGMVHVVWNDTNRGFAGGVNDGLAFARSLRDEGPDAIVTVNPDVVAAPDHIERSVAALEADDRRGSVQGKLVRTVRAPDGSPVIDTTGHLAFTTRLFRNRGEGERDRGQWDQPGEVFGVSGALATYRVAMLDDVAIDGEVFDEDLFAFWEDVDLDWRAQLRGWTCWYEPRATAVHERGGAGPRRTTRVEQLNWQNRLLVLVKLDTWPAFAPHALGFLVTLLLKTAELLLTVPAAFTAALRDRHLIARMRAKRAHVHARATVPSATVVARWFQPFDYGVWIRTYRDRVLRRPLGRD